ncbi:hypothetical protein B0T17DRAFT_528091 [Bombardia bombarda]|uniref:AAA+ ATPase domain-containing protein n=1 Tax=Bombardia bombarda TaxID=252184 RepID=A0AA39XAE5_9PEZI|nr:hypothetical protein B0T17DRAFT_528091 [Bombardia bombarda]
MDFYDPKTRKMETERQSLKRSAIATETRKDGDCEGQTSPMKRPKHTDSINESQTMELASNDGWSSPVDITEPVEIQSEVLDDGAPGSTQDLPQRPDVLYHLAVIRPGRTSRSFYRDTPWKGVSNGLQNSAPDENMEKCAVLTWRVEATVHDLQATKLKGNSAHTWRQQPADFEFGRDAHLLSRKWPELIIHSRALVKLMEQLLDYYPAHIGYYHRYSSIIEDTIPEIMYCYAELKAYFGTYSASKGNAAVGLDIGNCGDDKIADAVKSTLDFGSLNLMEETCDEDTARDLSVLLKLLAPMYRAKVVPCLSSLLLDQEPVVKYDDAWLLFKPGTYVYMQQCIFTDAMEVPYGKVSKKITTSFTSGDNDYSACIVASWEYKKKEPFSKIYPDTNKTVDRLGLELWCIFFDGKEFQRVVRRASILSFNGTKHVIDLPIVPATICDRLDNGALRKKLEERGKKYLSFLRESGAHRIYNHLRSGYQGQIIVDPISYALYNSEDRDRPPLPEDLIDLAPTQIADGGGGKRFRNITMFEASSTHETFSRMHQVYPLLPRTVSGFGLKNKKWMIFEIDSISTHAPVPSPNQLEDELVLVSDEDRKVLRTILPKGAQPVPVVSDFIPDKGEGKIFLLYGPPGTGKTMTVECVANDTRRPLLSLAAQDLLQNADVEGRLRTWFTVAAKWDAILLIDEADLFLEGRRDGNVARNKLATVFLRTMEYYKGVVFLTTNRPGHIDDSFISRITYPLVYHKLTVETKREIIKRLVRKIEKSGTIEFEPAAERYMIENCEDLNGRQLRNVLQSAVAAAEVEQRSDRVVAVDHVLQVKRQFIKEAISRQMSFQTYLKNLFGGRDESARARSKQDWLAAPASGL